MNRTATRGVLYVHSAPSALCPHVEWAAGGVLGTAVSLEWTPQPAQAGSYRAEFSYAAESGTAADAKKAHALFKKLEHSKRAAALNMLR